MPTKLRYCDLLTAFVMNVSIFTVPTYMPEPSTQASMRLNTRTGNIGAAPEIAEPASKINTAMM